MVYRVLVPDKTDGWREFTQPRDVFVAERPDEVAKMLRRADESARQGFYVAGFVSYEAASGFDESLPHHEPGKLPLAVFAVFDGSKPFQMRAGQSSLSLAPSLSRESYEAALTRIHGYLAQGDTYQVNFTQQLKGSFRGDVDVLMAELYKSQPTPYAMMLQSEDFDICCLSPELFFERSGQTIRTEPMKGTRPRGRYYEEDRDRLEGLRSSRKDQAENLMIVDMIRNDLGRVARTGSVKVAEMFQVKKLPTVWQKVSSVTAESSADLVEIFSALFPCASVTGAPKTRTMEIIRELESEARGVYTGAIGMIEPGGDCCFSVAIRTLLIDRLIDQEGAAASYGAGGGIVWDSDVEDEWQETLTKAQFLQTSRPEFQLLETMRYDPEEGITRLDYHLARLSRSADYFDFQLQVTEVRKLLMALCFIEPRRIRLLLAEDGKISLEDLRVPESVGKVRLKFAKEAINSNDLYLFHKTTHRRVYEDARASVTDCDDVLLFNEHGELTETSIANIFLEFDDELLTPIVSSGLLAGTLRQELLDTGRAREAVLKLDDVKKCRRLFVGNSLRGLQEAELLQ